MTVKINCLYATSSVWKDAERRMLSSNDPVIYSFEFSFFIWQSITSARLHLNRLAQNQAFCTRNEEQGSEISCAMQQNAPVQNFRFVIDACGNKSNGTRANLVA